MFDHHWFNKHASLTLQRLLPRIVPILNQTEEANVFLQRLEQYFPTIFRLLVLLYGKHYDFFYHLEQILSSAAQIYTERPPHLKLLDRQRETNPTWFKSEHMLGAVCYVDLFAGTLDDLRDRIPYFEELGITYLHLMPLFKAPENASDGGYAVSDYRVVAPHIGTMQQLQTLSEQLRETGISLVVDFVFNHTSNEHTWAQRALAGDEHYQTYYYMFDDRSLPDQYERTLREIFPEQAPGSFTFQPAINKWVWTTFNHFQWDLNYSNPLVFNAMLQEMLFLANQGVEVLRLDAVAFIWKQMGTTCENLPQAHMIIQAYNALARVVAPALLFKSEAIVHPDNVATYISHGECPLSYNPTLMALLWEALATRDIKLLQHAMQKRFAIPPDCAWVNYVRCHDDIGWTFADEDAAEVAINGFDHRQFLNAFYIGQFTGSFARGVPFNYNPITRDMRIAGMAASLAGLEQAQEANSDLLTQHALARLLLIHSVIISVSGIPLLYLGDEIAMLNDYTYSENPAKKEDSRWIHRPSFDWQRAALRHDPQTPQGWLFQGLRRLIEIRKNTPAFGSGSTAFFNCGNTHVLAYICAGSLLVLANFSERTQFVQRTALEQPLTPAAHDLVTGQSAYADSDVTLAPYQFMWLIPG